jgi:hypothetical protein
VRTISEEDFIVLKLIKSAMLDACRPERKISQIAFSLNGGEEVRAVFMPEKMDITFPKEGLRHHLY